VNCVQNTRFLTTREVADRYRIRENTLRKWRTHQRGPVFVRIEGRILYRESDLKAFGGAQNLKNSRAGIKEPYPKAKQKA
jgi:hypothetical protein